MRERQPTEEEVAQHFAFEHARSIMAVPEDQMPDEAQRFELIRRALAGQDIYAYTPAQSDRYLIWDRRPNPAQESRFTPEEWAQLWRDGRMPEYTHEQAMRDFALGQLATEGGDECAT